MILLTEVYHSVDTFQLTNGFFGTNLLQLLKELLGGVSQLPLYDRQVHIQPVFVSSGQHCAIEATAIHEFLHLGLGCRISLLEWSFLP